tara:strand:- start:8332 stop:8526 length:195 start_codon:yes stop_codon:yes gene_type:complete
VSPPLGFAPANPALQAPQALRAQGPTVARALPELALPVQAPREQGPLPARALLQARRCLCLPRR